MTKLDELFRKCVKENKDLYAAMEDEGLDSPDMNNLQQYVGDPTSPYGIVKRELSNLETILLELGSWSFKKAFGKFLPYLKKIAAVQGKNQTNWLKLVEHFEDTNNRVVRQLVPDEDENDVEKMYYKYSSKKVRALVDLLKSRAMDAKDFHAIIFVERKMTAYYLNDFLTSLKPKIALLRCDYVHGINSRTANISNDLDLKRQVGEMFVCSCPLIYCVL